MTEAHCSGILYPEYCEESRARVLGAVVHSGPLPRFKLSKVICDSSGGREKGEMEGLKVMPKNFTCLYYTRPVLNPLTLSSKPGSTAGFGSFTGKGGLPLFLSHVSVNI